MDSIFKPETPQNVNDFLKEKIHYACGKNVMDGWMNVDAFDLSYPDGKVDEDNVARIFYWNLVDRHPFPENYFRQRHSEACVE